MGDETLLAANPDFEQFSRRQLEEAKRLAYAAGKATEYEAIRASLCKHWLSEIECNHYEKNDSAICACGWKSDRGFNVGKAVELWVDHVFENAGAALVAQTSQPEVERLRTVQYAMRALRECEKP